MNSHETASIIAFTSTETIGCFDTKILLRTLKHFLLVDVPFHVPNENCMHAVHNERHNLRTTHDRRCYGTHCNYFQKGANALPAPGKKAFAVVFWNFVTGRRVGGGAVRGKRQFKVLDLQLPNTMRHESTFNLNEARSEVELRFHK